MFFISDGQDYVLLLLFSHSVLSDSLWPHVLQHIRLSCPSPSPRVCSNSSIESGMPSNNHILVIVVPLFSCLQSFPALGSLPMSWLFTSGSKVLELQASFQSTGASSISPSNEYSGSISLRIDWCDLFAVQETLKSLLQHHNSKTSVHQCSNFFFFFFYC